MQTLAVPESWRYITSMAQPRKYKTDAERYRAYRQRKKDREEATRRELERLDPSFKKKRSATFSLTLPHEALRQGLLQLRWEIDRRRKEAKARRDDSNWNPLATHTAELVLLLNYIEKELDRLMK